MYHKQMVRTVFPSAVVRFEVVERRRRFFVYAGPAGDSRKLGGGFEESEAWITAALSLALDETHRPAIDRITSESIDHESWS